MIEVLNTIGLIIVIILMIVGLFIFGLIIYRLIDELINEWHEEKEKKKNGK